MRHVANGDHQPPLRLMVHHLQIAWARCAAHKASYSSRAWVRLALVHHLATVHHRLATATTHHHLTHTVRRHHMEEVHTEGRMAAHHSMAAPRHMVARRCHTVAQPCHMVRRRPTVTTLMLLAMGRRRCRLERHHCRQERRHCRQEHHHRRLIPNHHHRRPWARRRRRHHLLHHPRHRLRLVWLQHRLRLRRQKAARRASMTVSWLTCSA